MVSIIVPIYQSQEYLNDCIESILSQTYDDLEIILVDDGSTDNSGKICDEYAQKDKRIKVIHQKNTGLSGARNTGLKNAHGEYISFVDSDDIVSKYFIEKLYALIQKYNTQIAVCDYEKTYTNSIKFAKGNSDEREISKKYCSADKVTSSQDYVISSDKMLRQWHGKIKKLETVVWNKLYHKSVFEGSAGKMYFPEGVIHEDTYVSHLWVKNACKIAITSDILYMYRMRSGSITKSKATRQSARQDIDAQLARLAFFRKEKLIGSQIRLIAGLVLHVIMYNVKMILKL